jgi:hypothetical protein
MLEMQMVDLKEFLWETKMAEMMVVSLVEKKVVV